MSGQASHVISISAMWWVWTPIEESEHHSRHPFMDDTRSSVETATEWVEYTILLFAESVDLFSILVTGGTPVFLDAGTASLDSSSFSSCNLALQSWGNRRFSCAVWGTYLDICIYLHIFAYIDVKVDVSKDHQTDKQTIYLSISLSVCLFVCPSVCLSLYLSTYLPVYLSVYGGPVFWSLLPQGNGMGDATPKGTCIQPPFHPLTLKITLKIKESLILL